MKQYLDLCQRIIDEGVWVTNKRTGKRCLTVINADLEYDASTNEIPLVTTRKAFVKSAIAELLGYLRGYNSAADFRAIGTPTWNANANLTKAWLNNPNRLGEDDMGRVYGVQGRGWKRPDGQEFDQLAKIVDNLKNGIDDRGEILTFWNPGEFDLGCLRPCMHTHTFSILGDTLYLTSYQRSIDVPLGLVFNMPQTVVLLRLMAQITGLKPGKVYHKLVNCHIYEDQIELMKTVQLKRTPHSLPTLKIDENIKTLKDIETWVTRDHFTLNNYHPEDPIVYPFSE